MQTKGTNFSLFINYFDNFMLKPSIQVYKM